MSSSVYYRFKAQKDESKISFDGPGISVMDLRREIAHANNLKLTDFELMLFDSNSKEYSDDLHVIPRSSLIVVKRMPFRKTGKGKFAVPLAAINGQGTSTDSDQSFQKLQNTSIKSRLGFSAMSRRFNEKDEKDNLGANVTMVYNTTESDSKDDEAAAMAAMFKAQTDIWEETQEKMSHAVPIYNGSKSITRSGKASGSRPSFPPTDRPLPPSYVCYRCGTKGHWIHDCPTNNDRDFDNRPRIKRTTGIPRSFLKAVDSPAEGKLTQGVMVTPEGGYVVAQPDRASWQKQVSRTKGLTASDIRERQPSDPELACQIDKKLFLEPVKTPCCGTSYCEECIHSHLLENDFICPSCNKKINSLERLLVDKTMQARVADYIDKAIKESSEIEEIQPQIIENSREGEDPITSHTQPILQNQGETLVNANADIDQILHDTIPQLQAQVAQLSTMLQNPSLPIHVRQSTLQQFHEYQMQLQQAHTFAALAADMNAAEPQLVSMMNQSAQQQWFQAPVGNESAYQRLPLASRRRNNKRERPSDFLEIGLADTETKLPRFWE